MCNCGKGRQQVHAPQPVSQVALHQPMTVTRTQVWFEYIGQTALTVSGSVSGMRYRFDRPGAKVMVDSRDSAAFEGLRKLRRIGQAS